MLRVLVVDDEPLVARSLERLLAARGFDVCTCDSGAAALGLLEAAPADVMVSDLNMPAMSGLELLAEARRRWPTMRRVLVSALAGTVTPEELAPCSPCAVLEKPFTAAMLLASLGAA